MKWEPFLWKCSKLLPLAISVALCRVAAQLDISRMTVISMSKTSLKLLVERIKRFMNFLYKQPSDKQDASEGLGFWKFASGTVSVVAEQPTASQCETNRFHILVWWVMPVSICVTTCCSASVTQGCEQPDLATEWVCVRVVQLGLRVITSTKKLKWENHQSYFDLNSLNAANGSECELCKWPVFFFLLA